jgi:hypothetical protein
MTSGSERDAINSQSAELRTEQTSRMVEAKKVIRDHYFGRDAWWCFVWVLKYASWTTARSAADDGDVEWQIWRDGPWKDISCGYDIVEACIWSNSG